MEHIAAATKLTSLSLDTVATKSKEADVVSALAALPDLQQLTWRKVEFGDARELSDSRLLQHLTTITRLELYTIPAGALQHLSLLTKLQHLSIQGPQDWAATNYPGLQELQALTSLWLPGWTLYNDRHRFPACTSRLTVLQQLEVPSATIPELNGLSALTTLTKLVVTKLSPCSTPLQLQALQHLDLKIGGWYSCLLHTSCLATCKQLRCLSLYGVELMGPGSLVASSMLQELNLLGCSVSSGEDGPAAMSPWELIFPGPGRMPHLTSLVLRMPQLPSELQDVEQLVACCSALRVLKLDSLTDEQCITLAQLTDLRELGVHEPGQLSPTGLRHLARLEQLTRLEFKLNFNSDKVDTAVFQQLSDQAQGSYGLVNKAPAGSPPDVSARLLHACNMAAAGQQQP